MSNNPLIIITLNDGGGKEGELTVLGSPQEHEHELLKRPVYRIGARCRLCGVISGLSKLRSVGAQTCERILRLCR